MGDFNPDAPSIIGSEIFPIAARSVPLSNPLSGLAMRIRPGAITPTNLHTLSAGGEFNGNSSAFLNAEISDTLVPSLTSETIFPGTDTGKIASSRWIDETGSANSFGKVAKNNDDTTYAQLRSAAGDGQAHGGLNWGYTTSTDSHDSGLDPLLYRGNRSSKYLAGGLRVASVTINARVLMNASLSGIFFNFMLAMATGASTPNLVISPTINPAFDGAFHTYSYTLFADPWSLAAIGTSRWNAPHYSKTWDDFVTTAGPFAFGINPINRTGTNTVNQAIMDVSGIWLTVNYCTEDRHYTAYPQAYQSTGWNSTPALGPNQRRIKFNSSTSNTGIATQAIGATGAGVFTANDVGATLIRASDGQVIGVIQSVTNDTTAVLVSNGASTNTNIYGYLGTAPSALATNTWYYAKLQAVATSCTTYVMQDPTITPATSPSGGGEHRTVYNTAIPSGSAVPSAATQTVGEMLPFLIDTGSIASQSEPYLHCGIQSPFGSIGNALLGSTLGLFITDQEVRSGHTLGQQITTGAATTYTGLKLVLSRMQAGVVPDQPLTIEVRHGAGASTGGGSLDATLTVQPSAVYPTGSAIQALVYQASFVAPFTSILNTQYVVLLRSAATAGKGWVLLAMLTNSSTVNGTTTAQVEGATIGGTTDAYINGAGSQLTTYDAAVALVGLPSAPSNFLATPKAAT